MLLYFDSPNFVNDRILNVWARMSSYILIVQPWIMGTIKESMDLVHHAAEGVPANPARCPFTIERCHIAYPMSERTFSFLLNNFDLDPIGSFHVIIHTPPFQPLKGFTKIEWESI
jgi:hypothetical protein